MEALKARRAKRSSGATPPNFTVESGLGELVALLPAVRELPWPRVLGFAAGKGGVGKSSSTSNIGALLAAAGYRTAIVDLDIQANQATLLGVAQDASRSGELDDGKSFMSAVVSENADLLEPVLDVRPNLHLVSAGLMTRKLSDYLTLQPEAERQRLVRSVIDHMARTYAVDIVVIDSRPAGEILGEVAMLASDYLAIPLKTDALSWHYGLDTIARLYANSGSSARLLGAYLFASGSGSSKIQADTRRDLEAKLAGIAPVFESVIPHSEKAAKDQSEHGLTADEYAMAAGELAKPFWVNPQGPRFAANSDSISASYASLAVEIVREMLRSPE